MFARCAGLARCTRLTMALTVRLMCLCASCTRYSLLNYILLPAAPNPFLSGEWRRALRRSRGQQHQRTSLPDHHHSQLCHWALGASQRRLGIPRDGRDVRVGCPSPAHASSPAAPLLEQLTSLLSQANAGVAFIGSNGIGFFSLIFDQCNITGNFAASSSPEMVRSDVTGSLGIS